MSRLWGDKRYHSLDWEMKRTFGEKVYKLALNGGMTCPNRDGRLGTGGCIFCSEGGSGDFAASSLLPVSEQIEEAKKTIRQKTDCRKFIAYFQAYTNTYAPVDVLRAKFTEAISHPDIAVLSIATRSDCFSPEIYALLAELNTRKPVWVELGYQSMHSLSHRWMRTGFDLRSFTDCVNTLSRLGIRVIAHVILGLPTESHEDMLASVRYLASLPLWGVKLQMLHILKGTALDTQYREHPFPLLTMEEYASLVVECLELLPEDMVIHRLTGDGPRASLTAPLWTLHKKQVLNTIAKQQKRMDSYQGKEVENG